MPPDKYLHLQFKKSIHHGFARNAELNPVATEPVKELLKADEPCLVLVRDKRQRYLWLTDRRMLRQDASDVSELFSYDAVREVHWMARENPFALPKTEFFDRLEIDLHEGGVEVDGLDQAVFPLLQFLQFVAKKQSDGE